MKCIISLAHKKISREGTKKINHLSAFAFDKMLNGTLVTEECDPA